MSLKGSAEDVLLFIVHVFISIRNILSLGLEVISASTFGLKCSNESVEQ